MSEDIKDKAKEVAVVAKPPAPSKRPVVASALVSSFKPISLDSTEMMSAEEMIEFADRISYLGFDTKIMRKIVISNGLTFNDVVRCIITQSRIGNNTSRLTDNIKDAQFGKEVSLFLRSKKIQQSALTPETMTLPRICSAFAPLTLKVRKTTASRIQQQNLVPDCSVEFQTPVLACYAKDNSGEARWLEAFSVKIKSSKETEEDAKKNCNAYRQIAINNVLYDKALEIDNHKLSFEDLSTLMGWVTE